MAIPMTKIILIVWHACACACAYACGCDCACSKSNIIFPWAIIWSDM